MSSEFQVRYRRKNKLCYVWIYRSGVMVAHLIVEPFTRTCDIRLFQGSHTFLTTKRIEKVEEKLRR